MNRITAALYRFLVVYLSVAMVVTSIPLAPRAAYADDAGAVVILEDEQLATRVLTLMSMRSITRHLRARAAHPQLPTKRITLRTNRPARMPALPRRAWPKTFRSPRPILMQQRAWLPRRNPRPMTAKSIPSCMRTQRSTSMPSLCRTAMCIRAMQAEALR